MTRNPYFRLALIALLLILAVYIDLSDKILGNTPFERNVPISLGLDLRGGLQALLEVPEGVAVTADQLNVAKTILQSRANALGVSEITMQVAPPRRIIAEFPGITNPEAVVASLKQTGLLEFVDAGDDFLPEGTAVKTDYVGGSKDVKPTATATSGATSTAATGPTATPGAGAATPTAVGTPEKVYHTIMTGAGLDTVAVGTDGAGNIAINFTLKGEESKIFADYTTSHVNKILAIVLDGKVISSPRINGPITGGQGNITGNFTSQSANVFKVQLQYGSLPVPVQVVSSQTVGATLGAESVKKSVLAGAIGLLIVMLFMILYYRLPGIVAALALITYAVFSLAIFKFGIPGLFNSITLTLPGIAGFILSIGMAVDANILIFERMKEEMRAGKILEQAIDLGFRRAWSSIRDSNLSTLITCVILFIFGSAFGASMVQGFSITLALGVLVSLFTATFVTRTYLHAILDRLKAGEHPSWFGL